MEVAHVLLDRLKKRCLEIGGVSACEFPRVVYIFADLSAGKRMCSEEDIEGSTRIPNTEREDVMVVADGTLMDPERLAPVVSIVHIGRSTIFSYGTKNDPECKCTRGRFGAFTVRRCRCYFFSRFASMASSSAMCSFLSFAIFFQNAISSACPLASLR